MRKLALIAVAALAPACGESSESSGKNADTKGALVEVTSTSKVGVLLDEIQGAMRERVAADFLAKDASFWQARAKAQLQLANFRLNFRHTFYEGQGKMQLPLPPETILEISLGGAARRATVEGHDYVLVDYALSSMLIAPEASPGQAEPALGEVSGTWSEPFIFPVDPELLTQRTGFACMDEAEFPPNSVDSEGVEFFYDQECEVEEETSADGCHRTRLPEMSCVEALTAKVGKVETSIDFKRLEWDSGVAGKYRVDEVTARGKSDLKVLGEELDTNRLIYRYIPPDSCAIAEGCVLAPGWRRLLKFNASEKNLGTEPVHIGDVDYFIKSPDSPPDTVDHHIFEFSACHNHYHFSHYGTFTFDGEANRGSKRAFCLESVRRYSNHEDSPLTSEYGGCEYQGISPGWGDQYNAGIECQWIDVTDVDTKAAPVTAELAFTSNPDGFLCEGSPVHDANGNLEFEPTEFRTEKGEVVDRPKCEFIDNWNANNREARAVTLPKSGEGMITKACERGQLGPLRNCGFAYEGKVRACQPGEAVKLTCKAAAGAEAQLVRVCEASATLGVAGACNFDEALSTEAVTSEGVEVAFTCPLARDEAEPGGGYGIYSAALYPADAAAAISCE